MRKGVLAFALVALLASGGVLAQRDYSQVEIQTVPVAEGIYMLIGAGGNVGVSVGDDGTFIVDDQFAPLVGKLNAAIAEISDEPVKMVLNTHSHSDHTGGNEAYTNAGAVVLAHDNVRKRMSTAQISTFFKRETPPAPHSALPVVTFTSTVTLHLNGQTILVEHVPRAHTDGDSIVWFQEANVVHMGDVFFNGLYPFIDWERGGSIRGMVAAIDTVLPRTDASTRVMPGHGPVSDRAGLQSFRNMLHTVADRIQTMIDAGKTVEEIVAAKPTAEFDAEWGSGFIKPDDWVRVVYRGMAR